MYRDGDEHGILNLLRPEYGISPRHRLHWFWEHRDNPWGNSLIALAECNGKIIGHIAGVLVKVKVGENIVTGYYAVELVVHPEFRRSGVFLAMGRLHKDEAWKHGFSVIYGLPRPAAQKGSLTIGPDVVLYIPILTRYFNIHSVIKHKYTLTRRIQVISGVVKILNFIFRKYFRVKDISIEGLTIKEILNFDDRFNSFWEQICRGYETLIVKNKDYLNWRYFRKPDQVYKVFIVEDEGQILGYVVLASKEDKGMRIGYIVDLLTQRSNIKVIRCLISTALKYFLKENVDLVQCWAIEYTPLYKVLREYGFIDRGVRQLMVIFLNPSFISEESISKIRNWYIVIGDSDTV